jgi:hypothetical protein
MCEQCGGLIDRTGGRASGAGAKIRFCTTCIKERRAKSYKEWSERDVNRESRNIYQQQAREKHGLKWKCKKFGITEEFYNSLPKHCFICLSKEEICWDHDHKTGLFRGLLCRRCNRMLGQMEDNPEWLRNAADYLEEMI